MGKKSSNEVRMIGVIPSQGADPIPVGKIPDDGTQVAKSGTANNATTVIHTVTAAKTLYLTALLTSLANISGAQGYGDIFITDDSDVTQYIICRVVDQNNTYHVTSLSFPTPLEIAAGWKVKILGSALNVICYGFVHGYEM